MRIRTIKPEWLDDDRLAACSSDARVVSVALITLSDDAGRGRLGVAVAGRVFPTDPSKFEPAVAELVGWYLNVYDVRGQRYFEIVNWTKHQVIRKDREPRINTPDPNEGAYVTISVSSTIRHPDDGHGDVGDIPVTVIGMLDLDLDLDRDQDLKVPEGTLSTSPTPTVPTYRISDDLELSEPDVIRGLFDYWIRTLGKDPKRVKLTKKRREHIRARLREGYTPADIFDAIRGVASSPFHMGKNDRKTEYNDLTFVCRNGENVERFRDMVTDPNRRRDDRVDWNYIATDQFA